MTEYTLDKVELKKIIKMTNRSEGQTLFLLELCDGDLRKLCKLEINLKAGFIHYCPGDKETVDELLKPIEVELKNTGHRGRVMNYMTGNKKFGNQCGIYWYSGNNGKEHGERILKSGIPPYWVNHGELKILK
jgi:hypothetical protein